MFLLLQYSIKSKSSQGGDKTSKSGRKSSKGSSKSSKGSSKGSKVLLSISMSMNLSMSYLKSYQNITRFLERNAGAFANCTGHSMTTGLDHPDQKHLTISCQTMPYRMPDITTSEKIIIGVLSGTGGDRPRMRKAIWETWARNHSVYFIVAGPLFNI